MPFHFQFTVPDSKQQLSIKIKNLAQSKAKELKVVSIEDGTIYMIEFDTDIQKKSFELN